MSKASGAGHRLDLDACTQVSVDGERRYVCQMTEIIRASTQLSPRDSRHYWRDLTGGNVRLAPLLVVLSIRVFNGMNWRLGGAPWPVLKPLESDSSPHQELGLQPGQLVRVKSKHAIESTLNRKLRNRGLEFGTDMLFCCGGSYRVAARVDRIVDERTGELLVFKTPSILLEGAHANGGTRPDASERVLLLARDLAGTAASTRGAGEHSMTDPFVSVVTPVYNDEPYLEECIRSVLSQSHQDFEYIICNNHSTDRSGEIAADYAVEGFAHPRRQPARVLTAGQELQLRPARDLWSIEVLQDAALRRLDVPAVPAADDRRCRVQSAHRARQRLPIDRGAARLLRSAGGAAPRFPGRSRADGSCSEPPIPSGASPP